MNFEVKSRHACFDLRLTEDGVNLFDSISVVVFGMKLSLCSLEGY